MAENEEFEDMSDKTVCGEPKYTVSEKSTTKFQGCQVDGVGKAIFLNDRVKVVAGVSEDQVQEARTWLRKTKAEVLEEYPLEE